MGLITLSTSAPLLSLDEVKRHLRIDSATEDALLGDLLLAATDYVERETGCVLRPSELLLSLDGFPLGPLPLPGVPLGSVVSIACDDPAGRPLTLSPDTYTVDVSSTPGRIVLKPGQLWPSTSGGATCVRVRYRVGYTTLPPTLRQATLLMLSHWHENREAATDRRIDTIPLAVESLLNQHIVPEVA